jgi:2-C-methyl-D-erythritol 4-phosphate cytidylyltransferase/2-C-methyl-D-erythritol 2,4-cyclodiphosphate synthase
MNIGIILAAGNSTRFNNEVPKQLYLLEGKPVINHSIDILSQCLDEVIIVTNTYCSDKIETNHTILVNNINDRIESIKVALDYIGDKKYTNIVIHDAARPFITLDMINELLESSKTNQHSQFYLELVNGLARKSELGWEVAPREDFIELCSPQITDFETFKYIFTNYIETKKDCEILPIICELKYNHNLIKGSSKYLRKITTTDDI